MIHAALCDDEASFRKHLSGRIMAYMEERGLQCTIEQFPSGIDLLKARLEMYDVIFLDYKMEGLNGMETARRIRGRGITVLIAFVSTQPQYACDGYPLHVLRYILKRRLDQDLPECLDAVCMALKVQPEHFNIIIQGKSVSVFLEDVLYLESFGRKIGIHFRDSKRNNYHYYGKMGDEEQKLSAFGFLRTHQSYLVNLNYITVMANDSIVMENGETIPVSRSREREVTRWVRLMQE